VAGGLWMVRCGAPDSPRLFSLGTHDLAVIQLNYKMTMEISWLGLLLTVFLSP
jgi:hypothetical protein